MRERYLESIVSKDALSDKKMAFISGPRQVGKTTLAKRFLKTDLNYFSWDEIHFKKKWVKNPLTAIESAGSGPIVLDELHKYRLWKNSLKGLYDRVGDKIPIVVTGSARLDFYRKGGDSLLGRYIPYRMYPLTVAENTKMYPNPDELHSKKASFPLNDLMQYTGFPEPLLKASRQKALRWSRLRLEQLVREDIRDFKNIQDLDRIKLLIALLPDRVGSPLSINSLKEDLQVAYSTIREWLLVLKSLYICFQVPPYSKNISRSLTKESKYYLYDWLPITNTGPLLENIVALHLLKACHFWTDSAQGVFDLHYIRTKDKLEIDFCVLRDQKPWMMVECKSMESEVSPAFRKISTLFPNCSAFQVSLRKEDRIVPGTSIRMMPIEDFLSMLI